MRLKKVISAIIGSFILTLGIVNVVHKAPSEVVNAVSYQYELYSGALTEGDYIIFYNGKAMENTISSNRLTYLDVTPEDDVIYSPSSNIIWHIEQDDEYWTIYNSSVSKYAASTGSNNQAKLEGSVTDNSRWTVTGSSTYEFVNKARSDASSNNKYLRNNGTYGFACYASATGGPVNLYKKTAIYSVSFNTNGGSSVSSQNIKSGQKVIKPVTDPTRPGFTFGGWYKEYELTNLWNFATDTVTSDTIIYAKWEENFATIYEVIFNKNDANAIGAMENQEMEEGVETNLSANAFTLTYHDFLGWAETSDGAVVYKDEDPITLTSDKILYAVWEYNPMLKFAADLNAIDSWMSLGYTYDYSFHDVTKITDVNDLHVGDKVVIAANGYDKAMGEQTANNRAAVSISKTGSNIDNPISHSLAYFTLEPGTVENTWAFKDSYNLYLYAASSSNNYLRSKETNDANGSFTVTIDDGVASLVAQGENTRNILRYNNTNDVFNCYASGQQDLCLYRYVAPDEYSNVDFRIRCGVDKLLDDVAAELGISTTYGIEVSSNEKTVKYASNNALYDDTTDSNFAYVVIDLGDILDNISRADVEFTVRAYVENGGKYYYSSSEKTMSVKSLVATYLADDKLSDEIIENLTDLKNVLKSLGVQFD